MMMMNSILEVLSSIRFVRTNAWTKKVGIVFVCLSAVLVIHLLVHALPAKDSAIIPFSQYFHSTTKSKTTGINKDFSRFEDPHNVVPQKSQKKILVLSYMRSGSTLVGDIIQSHPDVFYVYEPLLYLWDYYVPTKMDAALNLWKRTKSFWKSSKTFIAPPVDFMSYMFQCNLTANNLKFLTNAAHSKVFRNTKCPIYKNGMNIVNTSDSCVSRLKERCFTADAVLLKVVRLSMAEADTFLDSHPDVKIIHLVRDPRGILLSRMHFNNKKTGEMHNNYSNICRRISEDIHWSQSISYKYKGRILTVRYEDLAQNLKRMTRKLFDFVGLSLDSEVSKHLMEITKSEDIMQNGKIKAKKTRRKNPYKTAYKWRSELPFSLVQKVDQECKDLYEVMGYRTFTTVSDLRNYAVSARSKFYGDKLITATL